MMHWNDRPRCRLSWFAWAGLAAITATGCLSCGGRHSQAQKPISLRPLWTSAALSGTPGLWDASFSPDGSQVALALQTGKEGPGAQHQLWIVGQDGAKCVSRGPAALHPDWSPTGEQIAYLDKAEYRLWEAEHQAEAAAGLSIGPPPKLTLVNVKTGASRTLKTPTGFYGPPRWSPDGNAIALGAWLTEGEGQMGLVIVDVLGGSAHVVPIGDVAPPIRSPAAWSADGNHLPIMSLNPLTGTQEIWMANRAKGSAQRVWSVKEITGAEAVGFDRASGSPCYVSTRYGDLTETATESAMLLRYDVEAKGAVEVAKLTSAPGWLIGVPAISPDGKGMVTVSNNTVLLDKGAPPQAAILWSRAAQPGRKDLPPGVGGSVLAWSRDGTRIAISKRDGKDTRVAVYEFAS